MGKSGVWRPIIISLIVGIVLCAIVGNVILRNRENIEGPWQAGYDFYGFFTTIIAAASCLVIFLISIDAGLIISYFKTKNRIVLVFMIILLILTFLSLIYYIYFIVNLVYPNMILHLFLFM